MIAAEITNGPYTHVGIVNDTKAYAGNRLNANKEITLLRCRLLSKNRRIPIISNTILHIL